MEERPPCSHHRRACGGPKQEGWDEFSPSAAGCSEEAGQRDPRVCARTWGYGPEGEGHRGRRAERRDQWRPNGLRYGGRAAGAGSRRLKGRERGGAGRNPSAGDSAPWKLGEQSCGEAPGSAEESPARDAAVGEGVVAQEEKGAAEAGVEGNWLLLCDGGCERAFHTRCLQPQLTEVPEGEWLCTECASGLLVDFANS